MPLGNYLGLPIAPIEPKAPEHWVVHGFDGRSRRDAYWSGPRGNDPEWVARCTNALRALDELDALKREMDLVRERNVGIRCEGCGKAWTDDGESWQSWEDAWTCPACSG